MTELFETIERPIPEFENYTINCWGRVKNINSGRILKQIADRYGYYRVDLYKDGKQKHKLVHRLLAEIFLKCGKEEIDHKNGIRTDNNLKNLRICSHVENCRNRKNTKGVTHCKKRGKYDYWHARIYHNEIQYDKYFEFTPDGKQKALHWRVNKEIELFKEFASRV